ncbi:MAG: DUF1549 domain-containing protein [Planctomycetes bacterium]|nr:DUF1549 domain-containing protein [Planctomycetota bacterium]
MAASARTAAHGLLALLLVSVGSAAADDAPAKKPGVAKSKAVKSAPAARMDAAALARLIDQQVNSRLEAEGVQASPRADDGEFLRRAYLDLVGVIPPPEKVTEFLDATNPDKRARLIDELLTNPRFGSHMAETWSNLMLPVESNNRRVQSGPFRTWLAAGFNKNTPLNKLVHDLLTASGPQNQNGAVTYFIANPTVDKITDNVTKMFLGVRLQCAQCHNHPFVEIKQDEYWGMAGFFRKVRLSQNPNKAAKTGTSVGISEVGNVGKGRKAPLPESAKNVPARFLGGEQPKMNPAEPFRPVVAKWLTSADNPYFARAMTNRVWYQLFGRGICNPVDDMHDGNPPSHPELLTALSEQLKANDFDLRYLIRAICNSQAYQRTSKPAGNNKDDKELFSHAAVRVLTPEQLYDSLTSIVGQGRVALAPKRKQAAGQRGAGGPRDAFIAFFRVDESSDPTEYQAGIPQALRLMNSPQTSSAAVIERLAGKGIEPRQVIEQLVITVLSRRPTDQEIQRFTQYVAMQDSPRAGYADVLWALLNSSEFALNH